MNLAITAAPKHPDFRGLEFAKVDRPGSNYTLTTAAKTNNVLGEPTGYASFDDALLAARTLTSGNAPAAVLFEAVDRFYLKQVLIAEGSFTSSSWYDGVGSHKERAVTFSRTEAKALVDGDVVVRAGKVGQAVPFTLAH
jgi:hypothetical protein